eukprot:3067786-Karenia_brevis.AAC.1
MHIIVVPGVSHYQACLKCGGFCHTQAPHAAIFGAPCIDWSRGGDKAANLKVSAGVQGESLDWGWNVAGLGHGILSTSVVSGRAEVEVGLKSGRAGYSALEQPEWYVDKSFTPAFKTYRMEVTPAEAGF